MTGNVVVDIFVGLFVAALSAAAGRFSQPLFLIANGVLVSDHLPKVSGRFISEFEEGEYGDHKSKLSAVRTKEIVEAKRIGRYVYGKIKAPGGTEYTFQARITRDVITGQFKPNDKRTAPTGIGTFQLRAIGSDNKFEGYQTWVDYDTGDIEVSHYVWAREGS